MRRQHIGKQGDLGPHLSGEVMIIHRPADQDVRLQPDFPQPHNAVLGRFGLQLVTLAYEWNQGQVHDQVVFPPHFQA